MRMRAGGGGGGSEGPPWVVVRELHDVVEVGGDDVGRCDAKTPVCNPCTRIYQINLLQRAS
jgi:hypothetical protein